MPTDFWFRFSTYLSLVFACLCLGYAEWQFLPEVTAFTVAVIVLLVASFFLDRRFELSLAKANALGLGIGVGAVVWMAWNLTNPRKEGPLAGVEWPTNMLPLIGPLLMTLIPAKLFRPKHVGDWWAMHGVAVTGVALASSMAEDQWFVGLLTGYAVCSGWALVLFFYRRSGGFLPPVPGRPAPPQAQLAPADPSLRPPRWVFARTLLWLGGGAAVAVVLFVSLPRSAGVAWAFGRKHYEVGETNTGRLTMNKSGELTNSDEIAYRVWAVDAAGDPHPLDPDQHWRGSEFVHYKQEQGRQEWSWMPGLYDLLPVGPPTLPVVAVVGGPAAVDTVPAPAAGPGRHTVRFGITAGQHSPVVASPVWWPGDQSPVRWENGEAWKFRPNATMPTHVRRQFTRLPATEVVDFYTQVCGPSPGPGLGSPFDLRPQNTVFLLLQYDDRAFFDYARLLLAGLDDTLDRMAAYGELPADLRRPPRPLTAPVPDEWHEVVARAFAFHLRHSGEFTYTTSLEPKDRGIDPLVDFLKNTKSGHCEWFAGALVLTLRAAGIPAQYVAGYRGWDTDEDGNVVIRQRHSHAWAEALISRPAPPGYRPRGQVADGPPRVWHWLTLEPTSDTAAAVTTNKNWFERTATVIAEFLLKFDREKQAKTVAELQRDAAEWWPVWAAAGLAVAAGVVGWRWWKRRGAARVTYPGPPWYARLQVVLAARGLALAPGQTPREFAAATAAALPAAAEVVQFVTSKLYRVRYAGSPLAPDELRQIDAALDRLEATFRQP